MAELAVDEEVLWRRPIRGVQWISAAKLVEDCTSWAQSLPDEFRGVVGLPRSGLTVAHIVASFRNLRATQIHAPEFRQSTGRPIAGRPGGPWLLVDDCCSFGTAINEARRQFGQLPAKFGSVYARPTGAAACGLDHWHRLHGEPDWLVITEWNWHHHQDAPFIAVSKSAGPFIDAATGRFGAVFDSDDQAFASYAHSDAALLVVGGSEAAAIAVAAGKPVLDIRSRQLHGPARKVWPEKIFGVGLPRTGTTSLCAALDRLGWNTQHCPMDLGEVEHREALADLLIAAEVEQLADRYPQAKFVLTTRDLDSWVASIARLREVGETSTPDLDRARDRVFSGRPLKAAYTVHCQRVSHCIPSDRLLEFDVRDGWQPLCEFLGQSVPGEPFPHENHGGVDACRLASKR